MRIKKTKQNISLSGIRYNLKPNPQSGVTLLLSILVLSAITAISISLVTIAIIEIRASGDAQRTAPAVYGTLGIIEQAIFKVQRSVPDTMLCEPTVTTSCTGTRMDTASTTNVKVKVSPPQFLENSVVQEIVSPGYTTVATTKVYSTVYDVLNPNQPENGYTYIDLSEVSNSSGNLFVDYCEIDNTAVNSIDCSPSTYSLSPPWSGNLRIPKSSEATPIRTLTLSKNKIYKLYITTDNTTQAKYVSIKSFGPLAHINTATGLEVQDPCASGTTPRNPPGTIDACPKGLPLKGRKQYDVTASNADLTRKYTVFVPLGSK